MACNNSFSEDLIPRNAPSPTTTSPAEIPIVPEVSLIFAGNSKTYTDYPEPKKTFNSWQIQQNPTFKKSQPIKKHVRFIDPDIADKNFIPIFNNNFNSSTCNSVSPILCRDLELSIFEQPVKKSIQTIQPLRYSQIKNYDTSSYLNSGIPEYQPQPVIRNIIQEKIPYQPQPVIRNIIQEKIPFQPVIEKKSQEIVERIEYEPTVRDLFDLIQKQNSQLVSLQKQVENLLSMKDLSEQSKAIEEAPPPPPTLKPIVQEPPAVHQNQQKKMSIGVMTSFEFTIGSRNIETQTSVFNQIEEDNCSEYNLEDDETDDNSMQMGWTLYKNAMEHVENILQKSSPKQDHSKKNKENWMTMKSIEHLRHLDMNFGDCNISASQRFTFGQSAGSRIETPISNERSFAMNNLAMKYLPGDKLNEIVNKNQKLKSSSTDHSISTYKYMEKYGLLDDNRISNTKSNILDKKTIKNMPKLF